MGTKVTTIRLDEDRHRELSMIAKAEGVTVSEIIREAVEEAIEQRRQDPELMARLREHVEDNQRVLERLSDA